MEYGRSRTNVDSLWVSEHDMKFIRSLVEDDGDDLGDSNGSKDNGDDMDDANENDDPESSGEFIPHDSDTPPASAPVAPPVSAPVVAPVSAPVAPPVSAPVGAPSAVLPEDATKIDPEGSDELPPLIPDVPTLPAQHLPAPQQQPPPLDNSSGTGIPIIPSIPGSTTTTAEGQPETTNNSYTFPFPHFKPEEAEEAYEESVDWSQHNKMAAGFIALVVLLCILRCIYRCWRNARDKREQKSFDVRNAQAHMLLGDMQLLPTEDPDEVW